MKQSQTKKERCEWAIKSFYSFSFRIYYVVIRCYVLPSSSSSILQSVWTSLARAFGCCLCCLFFSSVSFLRFHISRFPLTLFSLFLSLFCRCHRLFCSFFSPPFTRKHFFALVFACVFLVFYLSSFFFLFFLLLRGADFYWSLLFRYFQKRICSAFSSFIGLFHTHRKWIGNCLSFRFIFIVFNLCVTHTPTAWHWQSDLQWRRRQW